MRIMSWDGGPAAALQIRILKAVEEHAAARHQDVLTNTDLFAGSSDGAYMALFLALRLWQGRPSGPALVQEAIEFSNALLDTFQVSCCDLLRFASGWRPLLQIGELQRVLQKYLGTATLGDLAGPGPTGAAPRHVVVVSFDIKTWRPKVFRNCGPYLPPEELDLTTSLVDVALASSAFPLLVPIHVAPLGGQYIDGAVVANNPTMAAISVALRWMRSTHKDVLRSRDLLGEVVSLSLGADSSPEEREHISSGCVERLWRKIATPLRRETVLGGGSGSLPWGYIQWFLARPLYLLDLAFQASVEEVSIEAASLLDDQYFRLSPGFPEMTELFGVLFGSPQKLESWLDKEAVEAVASPEYRLMLAWLQKYWLGDLTPLPT
jgi:hypothetical protein